MYIYIDIDIDLDIDIDIDIYICMMNDDELFLWHGLPTAKGV